MLKQNELLRKIMNAFPRSFINHNNELILKEKGNVYFRLDNIKSEIELKCAVLEWCSRDGCKSQPYISDWRNKQYHDEIRNSMNEALETNFDHQDLCNIYDALGNQVNRTLTLSFVESGYDMSILTKNRIKEW